MPYYGTFNVTRDIERNEKIFELFLFVVSEVSTGRRCLSLALLFPPNQKRLHCEKTKKKRQLSPVELASFFVLFIVLPEPGHILAACACLL
jgi:hypothetical protein